MREDLMLFKTKIWLVDVQKTVAHQPGFPFRGVQLSGGVPDRVLRVDLIPL